MRGCRVINIGGVDHGKSTLTGRIQYELGVLKKDEMPNAPDEANWSHYSDGLSHERDKNQTITVGHRYFYYQDTRFQIMDAPGHREFSASLIGDLVTADHVNLVSDITRDTEEVKERLQWAVRFTSVPISLLVNKMDLVNWSESVFNDHVQLLTGEISEESLKRFQAIPISAKNGDNLAAKSDRSPWYQGLCVFDHWKRSGSSEQAEVLPVRPLDSHSLSFFGQMEIEGEWYSFPANTRLKVIRSKDGVASFEQKLSRDEVFISRQPFEGSQNEVLGALLEVSEIGEGEELEFVAHRFRCHVRVRSKGPLATVEFLSDFCGVSGGALYREGKPVGYFRPQGAKLS